MLVPKKIKHRKWQKLRRNAKRITADTRGTELSFGGFGLKAMSPARVTSNQIESARKVIAKTLGKTGRVWIRIFPDMPVTAKAPEVPMGSGKGDPFAFCFEVLPGRIIFEIDGATDVVAREALRKSGAKLPLKSKVISREH